jgi:hypothetical protein
MSAAHNGHWADQRVITAISRKRHCELIALATPIRVARKLNSTDVIEALADLFDCCQVTTQTRNLGKIIQPFTI